MVKSSACAAQAWSCCPRLCVSSLQGGNVKLFIKIKRSLICLYVDVVFFITAEFFFLVFFLMVICGCYCRCSFMEDKWCHLLGLLLIQRWSSVVVVSSMNRSRCRCCERSMEEICWRWWNLVDLGEGSEEVAGIALLIRVGDELGIKFLVSGNVNTFLLLVFLL